jgi:hypothetical protein
MLRRDNPYVYEFIRRPNAARWRCRIFGRGANERGACHKLVEARWVLYALSSGFLRTAVVLRGVLSNPSHALRRLIDC